jgi:hypothetical protein
MFGLIYKYNPKLCTLFIIVFINRILSSEIGTLLTAKWIYLSISRVVWQRHKSRDEKKRRSLELTSHLKNQKP